MNIIKLIYKTIRKIRSLVSLQLDAGHARFLFYVNGAKVGSGLSVKGKVQIHVGQYAQCQIGDGLRMNGGLQYNRIGRQGPCQIIVGDAAELSIGDSLGMSSSAIICHHKIQIGNRVLIGGNVVIYDTDFHTLDPIKRAQPELDEAERQYRPVIIGDDVFIGAHSTILKGVTIGNGAIVGACSVVTRSIPAGEIWAGNPAKFIRKQAPSSAVRVA